MPRFLKTKDERIDDTLDYIDNKLPANSLEVSNLVKLLPATKLSNLGTLLSLGATTTKLDRLNNRESRRAKRALLLVASIFIQDAIGGKAQELTRIKAMPETSEADFLAELRSWFTVLSATKDTVADTAVTNIASMPNWNNINVDRYNAVRGRYSKAHNFNCYNAIVFWAFQAGTISKRFLWNKLNDLDGNHFFPIFSKAGWTTEAEYTMVSQQQQTITDTSINNVFQIPKGLTVYFVNSYKVFGHVALSLGDGTVISQNSVNPARPANVWVNESGAVHQMERAETHIISIKHLMDIHFFPENGYFKMLSSDAGFWEAYPQNER